MQETGLPFLFPLVSGGGLLSRQLLALLHKLFVALLELAHLFRFSRVLLHPLVKLVLVDDIAESEGLPQFLLPVKEAHRFRM